MAQAPYEAAVSILSIASPEGLTRLEKPLTSKMVYPHGCWQEPKFLVTRPLTPWQLTSPRRNEMRGQKPCLLLYNLASEGTLHHDCQIQLVTQPSPGRKCEGLIRTCVTAVGGASHACI